MAVLSSFWLSLVGTATPVPNGAGNAAAHSGNGCKLWQLSI